MSMWGKLYYPREIFRNYLCCCFYKKPPTKTFEERAFIQKVLDFHKLLHRWDGKCNTNSLSITSATTSPGLYTLLDNETKYRVDVDDCFFDMTFPSVSGSYTGTVIIETYESAARANSVSVFSSNDPTHLTRLSRLIDVFSIIIRQALEKQKPIPISERAEVAALASGPVVSAEHEIAVAPELTEIPATLEPTEYVSITIEEEPDTIEMQLIELKGLLTEAFDVVLQI